MKIQPVAAYIRVSTQEQKLHGISLDAQRDKLKEYATNNNLKIVEWYEDEGVSGRKLIKNRPALQRMIIDAEHGKFERIIFIKLDRFFRSTSEYAECMKRIGDVTWTATEEPYDLTTANGRFLVNAKLAVAELEADQTSERIKLVNEYKVKEGRVLYGNRALPYGFCVGEVDGKKVPIKDEARRETAQAMADYYLTHHSMKQTLIYCRENYDSSLTYDIVTRFMHSTLIGGIYRDNQNYCEPYVYGDDYIKLRELLERNSKISGKKVRDYIFSGVLVCPRCGRRMRSTISRFNVKGKIYQYNIYKCEQYQKARACTSPNVIHEHKLETLMIEWLKKETENVKAEVTVQSKAPKPKDDKAKLQQELERLNYSWQKGRIDVESYDKEYERLTRQLIEQKVPEESKKLPALSDDWLENYNMLTNANKNVFWRNIFSKIYVERVDNKWKLDFEFL